MDPVWRGEISRMTLDFLTDHWEDGNSHLLRMGEWGRHGLGRGRDQEFSVDHVTFEIPTGHIVGYQSLGSRGEIQV